MTHSFPTRRSSDLTRNSYRAGNDHWYALLTIYGNEPSGSELEFRIWDASTGKIYQASPSMELAFQSDAIAGTSRQPVIFRGEDLIFQELDLHQGWHWISLNVTGRAMKDVTATLSNGQRKAGT